MVSTDLCMYEEKAILELLQSGVSGSDSCCQQLRRAAVDNKVARKTEVECSQRLTSKGAHPAAKHQLYASPGEVGCCVGSNVSVKRTQDVVMRVNQLDCGFPLHTSPATVE